MKLVRQYISEENVQTGIQLDEATGQKSYFIEGIFMQGDQENRNKRVYPTEILNNEIVNYKESYINRKRAFGELGHPSCFHSKTEALTTSGWKKIKDIEVGEIVFTFDDKNESVKYQEVKDTYKEPYSGYMYHFQNRTIDTVVTPNHRFLLKNRYGKYEYWTAEDIANTYLNGSLRHHKIIKNSIGVIPNEQRKSIQFGNQTFDFDIFVKLLGFYLSEGWNRKRGNRPNNYTFEISQNEGEVANEIRNIIEQLGLKYKETKYKRKNTNIRFTITNMDLANYFAKFGICYDKYIDKKVIEMMDAQSAMYFLEAFIMGDGRGKLGVKFTKADAFSVSEQLIDDIIQVASIAGVSSRKTVQYAKRGYWFAEHFIPKENKKPLYFAKFIQTDGVYIDDRHLHINKVEDYNDRVYCLTVDNSNFLARDGDTEGKGMYTFWTGNSPQINLDRVSHMITDIRQEGSNFIGRAKIMDTPYGKIVKSFIDEGALLGVSSRGLGSVKENKSGISEVQNDFKLSTVDIVADPSAPDAFVDGIMENYDWYYDNGILKAKEIENIRHSIHNAKCKRELQERKLEAFHNFMKSL